VLEKRGPGEDPQAFLRESLAIHRELGDTDHPDVVKGMVNLARELRLRGEFDGEAHPDVAFTLMGIAAVLREQGSPDEAEAHLRATLELASRSARTIRSPSSPRTRSESCSWTSGATRRRGRSSRRRSPGRAPPSATTTG